MSKKVVFTIVLPVLLIALGLGGFFYYQTKMVKKEKVSLQTGVQPWELALDEIEKVWRGDFSLSDKHISNNCPQFYLENDDVPRELKACRPELFACYFLKRSLSVREGVKFKRVQIQFPEKNQSKHFPFDVVIGDGDKAKKYRFKLNSSCRRVELPQGFYWGSEENPIEKRLFHTSGRRFLVDKVLVRNIDIFHWQNLLEVKTDKNLEKIIKMKGRDFYKPAVNLTPTQMKSYCRFRGGQVLDSMVKTALTFHHGRENREQLPKTPPSSAAAPHPFGPRKNDSPQYLVKNEIRKFEKSFCSQIFSQECLGVSQELTFGFSWSGASELLGGPMEYVHNKKFPRKNVSPSSYYYPMNSLLHQAGKRIFWDGKGNEVLNFHFGLLPALDQTDSIDVGFRCMEVLF